jgi:hypothetical protein
MEENKSSARVERITDVGGRDATVLEQDLIRVVIDDEGGMIPELSARSGNGRINAHWIPWYRDLSGKKYNDTEHRTFWADSLLYHVAGNFLCLPVFGADPDVDGVSIPCHGWSANLDWRFIKYGVDKNSGAAWAYSVMDSPDAAMPLRFEKIDAIIPGHPVHYFSVAVNNNSGRDIAINAGSHNTLGSPFLEAGCRYSAPAKRWTTIIEGAGYDGTGRLALGTEFSSLQQAPLAAGGTVDISVIPPPIGYTDFAMGAVPEESGLGWSALVNPVQGMAYICFFTGPAAAAADDIILRFNCLWMQFGGRRFTPWAAIPGGTDLTYCLGTESMLAAYGNGLGYARNLGSLLGAPVTVTIPAGGKKILRYGTLFGSYGQGLLDEGVRTVQAEKNSLTVQGAAKTPWTFNADTSFALLKKLEAAV